MAYLRNPLAWYKRYVEKVYDMPSSPASFVGRAGHKALEHFYSGIPKEDSVALGLEYLKRVPDFEIEFGKAQSARAKKEKRAKMEADYLSAIGFYLAKAPRYNIVGIESMALAKVPGVPIPIKAISDLVVESKGHKGYVDIVDHKFVAAFSAEGADKPLFILQALFNYYTVQAEFGKPVKRFIFQECRKTKNRDGSSQMRKYVIDFSELSEEFEVFRRLLSDATKEISSRTSYLPNPSDMFEGKNSFDIYRLGLLE
jgi:hypothetical protein